MVTKKDLNIIISWLGVKKRGALYKEVSTINLIIEKINFDEIKFTSSLNFLVFIKKGFWFLKFCTTKLMM